MQNAPIGPIRPMLSRRGFLATASGLGAAGLAAPALSLAQISGGAPLRFIVPFGPGSGTDSTARVFAKAVSSISGLSVTVENKPGGNGLIAVQAALSAVPDGRTIFLGSNTTLSTNAALYRALPYNPLVDFTPIMALTKASCLLIVPPQSPYRTVGDLIADARRRPGTLNNGSGSPSYELYSVWFNEINKIETVNVAYKGANEVITAVVAGQVDYAITDASAATEIVRGGRVRALCVAAEHRLALLPDVPTCGEGGVPDFIAFNWVAAAAPAKIPPNALSQLRDWFRKASEDPDVKAYYNARSSELLASDADTMRHFQVEEIARWKRLAKISGFQLL